MNAFNNFTVAPLPLPSFLPPPPSYFDGHFPPPPPPFPLLPPPFCALPPYSPLPPPPFAALCGKRKAMSPPFLLFPPPPPGFEAAFCAPPLKSKLPPTLPGIRQYSAPKVCAHPFSRNNQRATEEWAGGSSTSGSSTSGSSVSFSPPFSIASTPSADFFLEDYEETEIASTSDKHFEANDLEFAHVPGEFVGAKEIAALIHHNLFGDFVAPPEWISGRRGVKFDKIALLRLECTDFCFREESGVFDALAKIFGRRSVPLTNEVTQRDKFWKALTTVSMDPLKIKIVANGDPLANGHAGERAKYLVTLEEMVEYGFALKSTDRCQIIPTKSRYRRVTDASPIFVIDCEMCVTSTGKSELTRVSMINEAGEVLLDTLVKPYNEIVNYVTEFSGITAQMMQSVTTRLGDVQRAISELLPEDAILCGHSIEGDLRHLKMKHPYCIDTSLQFNLTGTTKQRTKLRTLCKTFLNRQIQGAAGGHCSIEDCAATLELLRLKMQKGYKYGNVLRGWNRDAWLAEKRNFSSASSFSTTSISTASSTSTPRVASCTDCSAILRVACPATDSCLCRTRYDTSTRCVRCTGDALFHLHIARLAYEHTPSSAHINAENTFDFEKVLLTDNFPGLANLTDCLPFTENRVLFSAPKPDQFLPQTARCCLVDTAQQLFPRLPPRLGDFNVSLVDADCRAISPSQLINTVADAFCRAESGTLVLAMLSAVNGAMFGAIA